MCSHAQDQVNKLYKISPNNTIFGSVMVLDSTYIVAGLDSYGNRLDWIGLIIELDCNGDTLKTQRVSNDTIGYDFWGSTDLINTYNNELAIISVTFMDNRSWNFQFTLLDSNLNILDTTTFFQFTDNNQYYINNCMDLMQSHYDSSYTAVINILDEGLNTGNSLLVNFSNGGMVNWSQLFLAPVANSFRSILPLGIIQKLNKNYVISTTLFKTFGPPIDERAHIRLIETDSVGNVLQEYTDDSHPMDMGGEGLTLTSDNGLIFTRQRGYWVNEFNTWKSYSQIVKLDSAYNQVWVLSDTAENFNQFEYSEILPLENNEFVAVGATYDPQGQSGSLTKFNNAGEILWERSYIKVLAYPDSTQPSGQHFLYDVAQTPDSGFVMVGEARNNANSNHEMGQLGWLVKVDKHGCLVPGCEEFDNVDTTMVDTTGNTDTTITPDPPIPSPNTLIYPNPAQNELNVYYATTTLNPNATAYLFNTNGQIVNQWPITTNYTTYIVDVSIYAAGVYVLKIVDGESETIQKVVVE